MNTTQQAKKLVENYCEHYGININDLKRRRGGNIAKVILKNENHVNTASMRMALAYFIFMHFPIRIKEIASIVGYTDHSPISSQRSVVDNYIKNDDPFFMPYYLNVLKLANELGISTEYRRMYSTSMPFIRHESNTEFAEQIKYYENA